MKLEKDENKDRRKISDEEPSNPQRRNDPVTRKRKSSSLYCGYLRV